MAKKDTLKNTSWKLKERWGHTSRRESEEGVSLGAMLYRHRQGSRTDWCAQLHRRVVMCMGPSVSHASLLMDPA